MSKRKCLSSILLTDFKLYNSEVTYTDIFDYRLIIYYTTNADMFMHVKIT